MKKGLCEIVCIVDRSGSMESIKGDAIGAFNGFLSDQKKYPGEALLTYVHFDDRYEIVHFGRPISEVPGLSAHTFVPRGSTALLDAIGRTVDEVGFRLASTKESERPERVLVAILTDGEENASCHYSRQRIFDMIKHQREKYSWEFLFLAAGQDAFVEATALGIAPQFICAYAANDGAAHLHSVKQFSNSTSNYRSGGSAAVSGT